MDSIGLEDPRQPFRNQTMEGTYSVGFRPNKRCRRVESEELGQESAKSFLQTPPSQIVRSYDKDPLLPQPAARMFIQRKRYEEQGTNISYSPLMPPTSAFESGATRGLQYCNNRQYCNNFRHDLPEAHHRDPEFFLVTPQDIGMVSQATSICSSSADDEDDELVTYEEAPLFFASIRSGTEEEVYQHLNQHNDLSAYTSEQKSDNEAENRSLLVGGSDPWRYPRFRLKPKFSSANGFTSRQI